MSAPHRYNTRYQEKLANAAKANKPVTVCPPAPMMPSKYEHTIAMLYDIVEPSNWLFNHWDAKFVDDKDYLTYYIEGGRTRLRHIANNIEEVMKFIREFGLSNTPAWNKMLRELENGAGFVIWAIRGYMPKTKNGIYIKDDADWILRNITGDEDARY